MYDSSFFSNIVDKNGYFIILFNFKDMSKRNFLDSALANISKSIEINSNLFAQIQSYVQEIEKNPSSSKWITVNFDDSNGGLEFYIVNNTGPDAEEYGLSDEPGVTLNGYEDNCVDKKWELFIESELYRWFVSDNNEPETVNMNFGFDANSFCIAIQYLAECCGCPCDKITLEIENESLQTLTQPKKESIFTNPIFWGIVIIEIILISAAIFLFYSEETFAGIVSVGCMIWVGVKFFNIFQEGEE